LVGKQTFVNNLKKCRNFLVANERVAAHALSTATWPLAISGRVSSDAARLPS